MPYQLTEQLPLPANGLTSFDQFTCAYPFSTLSVDNKTRATVNLGKNYFRRLFRICRLLNLIKPCLEKKIDSKRNKLHVVNAVNGTESMEIKFPADHEEQRLAR